MVIIMQYVSNGLRTFGRGAVAAGMALALVAPVYAHKGSLREGMYEMPDKKVSCFVMRDDDSHDLYEICKDARISPALHTRAMNGKMYEFGYGDGDFPREIKAAVKGDKQTEEAEKRRTTMIAAVKNHPVMSIR